MGRLKILFIKNRCKKIERHKRKRKKYKKNRNNQVRVRRSITLKKLQHTFQKNKFFERNDIKNGFSLINIPQNFSLIDNPEESLITLKKINYLFEKSDVDTIEMDYSKCKKLGLEASVLTDLLVLNGLKYRNVIKKHVKLTGNQPTSYNAGEIFWNSGLLKHLNLSEIEDPRVERLDPFKMIMNDTNSATNETIKYINNCLKRSGYILNGEGISYFAKLVGEIIGNSQEHSGPNGEWYVSGHFTQTTSGNYGKGCLCFISIGDTIYYNLMNNCKSKKTHQKIVHHLKCHKGLFNIGWNEESSVTVFGLQYKISSKTDENHVDRGTGTIKFIDSFANLGQTFNNEKPKMSIISGSTYILFDGTYNLQEKETNKGSIQTIAFNKENNLKKRPDPNYVKVLKNSFPGVIISLEFYLDKTYLDKLKEGK